MNISEFRPKHRPTSLDHLVSAMTKHWESKCENVASEALQKSWRQAFVTFGRKIDELGTNYEADWHVLSPKTGTGKSESLKVYAAQASRDPFTAPGILIVVRLIDQANEFVRDINDMAGEVVAAARHSESDTLDPTHLRDFPVLVITHAAFTGRPRRNAELWDHYMAQVGGRRRLVVIDEAIDVLDIARLDADLLNKLLGNIPRRAQGQWPDGFRAIKCLQGIFERINALPGNSNSEARVVLNESQREFSKYFPNVDPEVWQAEAGALHEIEEIRQFMRSEDHRYLVGKRNVDAEAERRQKNSFDRVFRDLIAIYDSFILHWKSGKRHSLSTATRLLPDDGQGCVVLDATADTNPIYECMERETHNVSKHPAISSRTYANATLRASFGHAVGRSSLTRPLKGKKEPGAKTEAPKLWAALTKEHARRASSSCPMERVLVVCHKDAKQHLAGYEVPFEYDLAHYGALDGRNDWRNYDSAVIFGLDYRHPADAPTQFMALQPEAQDTEWLRDPSKRAFRGYPDIRAAIEQGVIASSVIQAVNRIRTRKVIDAAGNCPESYVYLLLPENDTGKAVYDTLRGQMPGIKIDPWRFEGARKVTRSEHEASFTTFIESLSPGESWSATEVKKHLGISKAAWERLSDKLRSDTTAIGQLMAELGVSYEVVQQGSRRLGTVVKRQSRTLTCSM